MTQSYGANKDSWTVEAGDTAGANKDSWTAEAGLRKLETQLNLPACLTSASCRASAAGSVDSHHAVNPDNTQTSAFLHSPYITASFE